jgi:DNA-binding NarL/FixJ family response regulator
MRARSRLSPRLATFLRQSAASTLSPLNMISPEPASSLSAPVSPLSKRLLIVDDHPIFRHGIAQLIGRLSGISVCGEAENAQTALEAMRRLQPDMALVDIWMPGMNGIELIKLMLAEQPALLILTVSMHDESVYALRALRAGAKGYVMKQQASENVCDALRTVANGDIYVCPRFSERLIFKAIQGSESDLGSPVDRLSPRELEVLQFFGKGRTTREVAELLHISVKTIETHRTHIKEKLGFRDAEEMVKFGLEWVTAAEG